MKLEFERVGQGTFGNKQDKESYVSVDDEEILQSIFNIFRENTKMSIISAIKSKRHVGRYILNF